MFDIGPDNKRAKKNESICMVKMNVEALSGGFLAGIELACTGKVRAVGKGTVGVYVRVRGSHERYYMGAYVAHWGEPEGKRFLDWHEVCFRDAGTKFAIVRVRGRGREVLTFCQWL